MAWTHTRSEIARAIRKNPNADVSDLKVRLRAERLEEHVRRVLEEAPPLNDVQRARIARLLRGGVADTYGLSGGAE